MKEKVGIAVIGSERRNYGLGRFIVNEVNRHPNANLIAIVGRNRPTHPSLSGFTFFHVDQMDQLFKQKNLDLIIISSPDQTHFKYLKTAVDNGKHVLVEKPLLPIGMAELENEVSKIFNQADQHSLLISTNCQRAFIPVYLNSPQPSKYLSVKIEIGIKNSKEDIDTLYRLLISHPVSIFVKLGLNDIKAFHKITHIITATDSIKISFMYRTIQGEIYLKQSSGIQMANLELSVDGKTTFISPVQDSGKIMTKYSEQNTIRYSDDLLKISIDMIIKAILNKKNSPLISNIESIEIFRIENLFYRVFKTFLNV